MLTGTHASVGCIGWQRLGCVVFGVAAAVVAIGDNPALTMGLSGFPIGKARSGAAVPWLGFARSVAAVGNSATRLDGAFIGVFVDGADVDHRHPRAAPENSSTPSTAMPVRKRPLFACGERSGAVGEEGDATT